MRIASLVALLLVAGSVRGAEPSVTLTEAAPPYRDAARSLLELIKHEANDKKLPSVAVALVDDQKVVWAAWVGAKPETIYRVGSVSKLFTDVAIMQLVEEGKLDLDSPVAKYVPEFKPAYKKGEQEITLRMLMAHRSGLIREPPIGNYFDPTEPSLEKSVMSLNGIELVYPPGTRTKYSNAAIGLVGYVIQKVQKEKFESYIQRRVLDLLDMESSSFTPTPAVKKNLAEATMWTYHGREFPAATFELGVSPAGCMYSTVTDLAKFQSCLFANGKVGKLRVLKPETIAEMFTPQFTKDGPRGFGLGFIIDELEGKKRASHGGAIYGFATEFAMLPNEKLGAIVVSSRDVSNAVTTRIANDALRLMLAAKEQRPLPKIEFPETIPLYQTEALVGRYRTPDRYFDITESFGRVFVQSDRGGSLLQLRRVGKHQLLLPGMGANPRLFQDQLIVDDVQGWGPTLLLDGDRAVLGNPLGKSPVYFKDRPQTTPPPEAPEKWKGLIGEYGWDHNTLYIYERDGKLHALIEWVEIDPLTEESENVFAFPADRGMYHGEKLVFTRDKTGRATKVTAASVVFEPPQDRRRER
ncbi:MAG: serine hydrolase domain-containing protein [Gemmataceae bacterium]